MSVFSWFKGGKIREGALFGIELEVEGEPRVTPLGALYKYFNSVPDGSLRDGVELVSIPLTFEQAQEAADMYTAYCANIRVNLSPRCSTHIHVNIQDMEYEQLRSFIWLAAALEPVLLRYCSELRNHNTYTVPMYNATNLVQWWRDLLKHMQAGNRDNVQAMLTGGAPKYCAVGAFRMYEYGTIEFRMFPGCKDGRKLMGWIGMLNSIRELAMTHSVELLRDRKIQQGVRTLLTEQLLEMRKAVSLSELDSLVEKGVEMANDITRGVKTVEDLLRVHKQLFPDSAPFVVERGMFGQHLLGNNTTPAALEAFVRTVSVDEVNAAYGRDQKLLVLYKELMAVTDPVTAADIIITLKRVWGV
jgi:hypothetical protein